jgi:hypothetical protein
MAHQPSVESPLRPLPTAQMTAPSGASWGAIFAGAIVACTATFSMSFAAAALGLSLVSPWWSQTSSATTLAASGAVAIVLIQWISSAFGGFVTGRLRSRWDDTQADEVFFRDTVNGLLAWCVATLMVVGVAAGAAMHASRAATQVAGGVLAGSGPVAAEAADRNGYFVDMLLRPAPGASAPAASDADLRGEVTRILAFAGSGDVSPADRNYLVARVAQRTGLPQAEAETRVSQTLSTIASTRAQVQQMAEEARKNGRRAAILTFLSLLVGEFVASAASALGAHFRDNP